MSPENISNTETPFYAKKQPTREDILQNDKIAYRNSFKALRDDAQNLIQRALQNPEAISYEEALEAYKVARFINQQEKLRLEDQRQLISLKLATSKFKAGNL